MPASLDLDALFGVDEPLTLTWRGRVYDMIRPQALGARDLVKLSQLQKQVTAMSDVNEAAQVEGIPTLLRDSLSMVCPTLDTTDMPFIAQIRALEFYIDQTITPDDEKKRITQTPT